MVHLGQQVMPYITVTANGEEIDRVALSHAMTIGRAPECDVSIRDILLSRTHCRLEPCKGREKYRWKFVDLGSRNGSFVNHEKVTEVDLIDGDTVVMGRTRITFLIGEFEPMPESAKKNRVVRPADPHEALSGTVAAFVFNEHEHESSEEFDPAPSSPVTADGFRSPSGATATVLGKAQSTRSAVAAVAASQPRTLASPRPRTRQEIAVGSRTSQTDISLQVLEKQLPFMDVVPELPARKKRSTSAALIFAAGAALATAVVLLSRWAF
jgi:pSer/pThr/pTyr-binding forkhead associated (FHA) protein